MSATMDLETAERVIAEHREREREERREAQKAYIGRFFKYRNRYSMGEEWWLYGAVTGIDEFGSLTGFSFQRASDDRIEIVLDDRVQTIAGQDREISADEFWQAARDILATVTRALSPTSAVTQETE